MENIKVVNAEAQRQEALKQARKKYYEKKNKMKNIKIT